MPPTAIFCRGANEIARVTPLQSLTDIIADVLLSEREVKTLSGQPFTLTLAKP
ncbi:hypothetical protein [Erwinia sp.]|uniref:hypothetical protein n=1 Tax=Erwinia citreus TaxID=558 RepID=UPI0028A00F1C|nr:hypothetical protein [Erwinia sp.]